MVRKPIPGQDDGEWGELINDYLDALTPGPGEVVVGGAEGPERVVKGEAEAWQSFRAMPDGPVDAMASGQSWHHVYGSDDRRLRVVDGALTNNVTDPGLSAGYAEVELTGDVTKIGATMEFSPYTTDTGCAAIVIWSTEHLNGNVPYSPLHLTLSPTRVSVDIWETPTGADTLRTVTFDRALATNNTVEHSVDVVIDDNSLTVTISNGVTFTLRDDRIRDYAGAWACWEVFALASDTDTKARFCEVWADSGVHGRRADGGLRQDMAALLDTRANRVRAVSTSNAVDQHFSSTPVEAHPALRIPVVFPSTRRILVEFAMDIESTGGDVFVGLYWDSSLSSSAISPQMVATGNYAGPVAGSRTLYNVAGATATIHLGVFITEGEGTVKFAGNRFGMMKVSELLS